MSEELPSGSSEGPDAPDFAKTLIWAQRFIRTNWEALVKPPVLIVLLLAVVAAYYFGSSHSGEVLRIKDERILALNEQLTAYKDRLQGATPDQAAKEMATLRSRLAEADEKLQVLMPDEPRHISEKQKQLFSSHTNEIGKLPKFINIGYLQMGDSFSYALEFQDLFFKNNMSMYRLSTITCNKDERGLILGLRDRDNPSEGATIFFNLLKESGFDIRTARWKIPKEMPEDFGLMVCP